MYFLIFGAILFFIPHFYSAFRDRSDGNDIREKLGYFKFMALYSLPTLLGFVLMIWGFGLARPSPVLYAPPEWGRHITLALMLPALILLFAAYGPKGYIKQYIKHPMLLAIILWALGHLASNGEVNSLILFGSFLAFGLIDWLAARVRETSLVRPSIGGDIYAIIIGGAIYLLFVKYLHALIIGVPILS